ncbi:alpha-1,2-fucosyltransferase [Pedobacter sp. BS3]|uniref:alpha-1,2-fucosyltransferase n=1 Tax=Pedobacter sp. BS3 TaxID=2567937 RepID=UPI0011ECBEEE|nr:alpha-1,2-fucosyltransferase [Pedobacter sp. BS3]TZF84754.1 alpha-1,2-fucosyltransferase [Pedobacter sp. BS3]
MTGVTFKGRLGNQLFQLYFLIYLRRNNPRKFIFFVNPHHAYLTKYFDLGTYRNLVLGSKLYSVFTRYLPIVLPFKEVYIQNFVAPREIKPENFTIYNGYFQTDWYLKHTPGNYTIKIKQKYIDRFNQEFGELFAQNKTIVVHIRRTDYMTYGKRDISLPIGYFQKRLAEVENLDSYKVLFVSDDIEFVKASFENKPNYIFSVNDEITDFQIIQNADIAIISNSSFAWWAAYLSEKNNKVIAPKNWMAFRIGREHPRGVMTDKFTWVEVEGN